MNADFILAIGELGKEKGIDPELLFQAVEEALVTAYKKNFGSNQNVRVDMNKVTGELHIYAQRHIVAEVGDDPNEISLEEARKIDPRYEVDDIVETEVTPRNFGRIAAQNAKQVVVQRIREAERGMVFEKFSSRENDIVTGIIQRMENKNVYIESPYFAPDDGLLEALKTAALSGVDVKIIIPAKPDHFFVHSCSLSYIGELLESGVRCFEYRKGFIHSKVMTMDGIVTSVGTANMDIRSYKLNFEVNAFIYNNDVTAEFDKQFNIDINDCTEITLENYKKRGIIQKIKESFARLISPLL